MIEAPVVVALVRIVERAGPAARVYRAKQELRQSIAALPGYRIVGQAAAEAEAVAPSGVIPVVIQTPHQPALHGVLSDNLGDVVLDRVGLHALYSVLPLLRPESEVSADSDGGNWSELGQDKVQALDFCCRTPLLSTSESGLGFPTWF